jgi:hypothetical protein
MFKIYVFVYDISLQNVFIGSVLTRKKDIITIFVFEVENCAIFLVSNKIRF